eukprot:IDg19904t1
MILEMILEMRVRLLGEYSELARSAMCSARVTAGDCRFCSATIAAKRSRTYTGMTCRVALGFSLAFGKSAQ